MEQMSVAIEEKQGITVFECSGRLDSETYTKLQDILQTAFTQAKFKFVIGMSNVEYIGSAGWSVFISKLREVRQNGGDIILYGMNAHVREVYDILELHEIILSFKTFEEAVKAFSQAVKASK